MAATVDPKLARHFAEQVVRRLRAAGYEALWAGGCVRDGLLGREPTDYDVATSAAPVQVREVFGRRRTIPIGAAFGVITVLGGKGEGQIEVATFRRDAGYSDGRRPDSVTFTNAEEDARRRDFTINGLFFDPLAGQVIDYVGGREDLRRGVVRAIGDPHERFDEDKLRMLRAVRFAATFSFELEAATLMAIRARAEEMLVVSAERIAAELRRMLAHHRRHAAADLLLRSRLLPVILPESREAFGEAGAPHPAWKQTVDMLAALSEPAFAAALAVIFREVYLREQESPGGVVEAICRRWKLSNDETRDCLWLLESERMILEGAAAPWPRLQPIVIDPRIETLLDYAAAVGAVTRGETAGVEFCRDRLSLPPAELNPPPLIGGHDLKQAGIQAGPAYRAILQQVRDAQLEGQIHDLDSALNLARGIAEVDPKNWTA